MFKKDRWPFIPSRISDIIDPETLAVIQSGCSERLKRPLTVMDYDPATNNFKRIESFNEKERYEEFCRRYRADRRRDELCKDCDIREASRSIDQYYQTGEVFREFYCHRGLIDMTHLICIHDHPLAVAYSGQYQPENGKEAIIQALQQTGSDPEEKFPDSFADELLQLADQLPVLPADAAKRLAREAKHVQRIAEAEYERKKREWEEQFLDELRQITLEANPLSRESLQHSLQSILEKIRSFCRCEFMAFFGNDQEHDLVLRLQAKAGIALPLTDKTPHFNWKKAGFPTFTSALHQANMEELLHSAKERGIRGDQSSVFMRAACIVPSSLGDRYRGVLVFGPFAEKLDLQAERRFLIELGNTIGLYALNGLEVLYLEDERKRWKSTAQLLTHQFKTALTPINNQIGRAMMLLVHKSGGLDVLSTEKYLRQAEDMVINLSNSAQETLAGHVLSVQPGDCHFQSYPLSVLVQNCATGFADSARDIGKDVIIDNSIEMLPEANVDIARLTIALANLIDNALKYSYTNTKIYIRSRINLHGNIDQSTVTIEVDDIGTEIRQDEIQEVFKLGTRGTSVLRAGRVRGSGLGLWEAQAIVRAHGGEIQVSSEPTNITRREGRAYRVIFSVTIPVRQK